MAIQDDFTIDYSAKTITHTAGTTVYTVKDFYLWLADLIDDAEQMDDEPPMTAQTPTEYTLVNGWTIPDASFQFLKGGSVKTSDDANLWANLYTIGSIQAGTSLYVVQNGNKITPWWGSGHIDILVKVKASSALIDSGKVTVFARELSDSFEHYEADLSAGGRNPIPLATQDDAANQTASGTIAGYSDITLTFGTVSKTLGGVTKNYDVVINCATRTVAQVYEYLKYITRSASAVTINGVPGWRYKSANASYTEQKAAPFGTFAGGKFFGARGVWIENYNADDAKNFELISADNTRVVPPNVVPVKVTGVVSGDRVAVFRLTGAGGAINTSQFLLAAGNNSGNATVVIQGAIPADTPNTGAVRIGSVRYPYSSWNGSTFTLDGATLAQSYSVGTAAFVPLIDELASAATSQTTLTFASDIPVLVRVRKKGILPFEVESMVTATGLSVAAIRTADSIVS